jgi:hypothetical protein
MELYYNTVSDTLCDYLKILMEAESLQTFRLVGGTALSLQLGHRQSIDIDLFSDAEYGNIDFDAIESFLVSTYDFCSFTAGPSALGKSYLIGTDINRVVKLDVYYTDTFILPANRSGNLRLANIAEIAAMKIDVIQRGGRKKDFWDIHELLDHFSILDMINLRKQRYAYAHDRNLIINNLTDFEIADNDFDPICLKGKYWAFIKDDIEEALKKIV